MSGRIAVWRCWQRGRGSASSRCWGYTYRQKTEKTRGQDGINFRNSWAWFSLLSSIRNKLLKTTRGQSLAMEYGGPWSHVYRHITNKVKIKTQTVSRQNLCSLCLLGFKHHSTTLLTFYHQTECLKKLSCWVIRIHKIIPIDFSPNAKARLTSCSPALNWHVTNWLMWVFSELRFKLHTKNFNWCNFFFCCCYGPCYFSTLNSCLLQHVQCTTRCGSRRRNLMSKHGHWPKFLNIYFKT